MSKPEKNIQRGLICAMVALAFSHPQSNSIAAEPTLKLQPNDRIVFIGNGLAERMQHDGWLETMIAAGFPKRKLSFRNLAFAGDELTTRARSPGFGSPDEWLTNTKADVVFAFFGYNESFAGKDGLKKFRADLTQFIRETLKQKYNGKSAPRLVLFSPVAFENLKNPNLPDGRRHNTRLLLYTRAMRDVAAKEKVPFVDLFEISERLYRETRQPLTINGIHLTPIGNRKIAFEIAAILFPETKFKLLTARKADLKRLNAAVRDKNFHWYHRYRTTDGYNIYGGRSHLRYPDKTTGKRISNREVCGREMRMLDVMTANRDKRIWSVGQAQPDLPPVDDSNVPPAIPITSNKPGPLPGGKYRFLSGKDAIKKMTVAKGLRVNLFASEEKFPELVNPVQMSFDTKGRLWVAAWPTYPHWKPGETMDDKLLILEDTDGDGKADKCKTFAGGLHCPTGFEFWNGGVLVVSGPTLLFLKDTDGDDKADRKVRMLDGFDTADSHHTANSFVFTPGGDLLFGEGMFHMSQFETLRKGALRNANACFWKFNPRTFELSRHIPANFANPHGHAIDRWGQGFIHDGTGGQPYHTTLISGHLDPPQKHPHAPQLYRQRTRPVAASAILSSSHFPKEFQGNLLVANVIGFQGILRYRLFDKGAGFGAKEVEPILRSTDENFRPTDIDIGPRGALFVSDWQNPIIGHMQHHLRDPNRDRTHGRVYRITCKGRPLLKPAKIAWASVNQLLDILKSPNDRTRYRARIELSARKTKDVVAAVRKWVDSLDQSDTNVEHHRLEALWLLQQHNHVDVRLLHRVLRSREPRARAAAVRVLCDMRRQIANDFILSVLKSVARTGHPRVQLEVVRACSFIGRKEAAEIALLTLNRSDASISFVLEQTLRQLETHWRKAFREGKPFAIANPRGQSYLLNKFATHELLTLPKSSAVHMAILLRPGIDHKRKIASLNSLTQPYNINPTHVLLKLISGYKAAGLHPRGQATITDLAHLLTMQPAADLKKHRDRIVKLATSGPRPIARRIGYVALIAADGSTDAAWKLADGSDRRLIDLFEAIPLIRDPKQRRSLYGKVKRYLHGLPANLNVTDASIKKLRVATANAVTYMPGHEKEVFVALSHLIQKSANLNRRHAEIRAIARIPKRHWKQSEIQPLLNKIVAHVKQQPAKDRTKTESLDALQLARELATLLPAKERKAAQSAIGKLGIPVIRIRPVPHRMMFDRRVIAVEAGKPVQIVFENVDIMPHNLLVVSPGKIRTIGEAAEEMATQPGALGAGYVPDSDDVLFATKLLHAGEVDRLTFIAPKKPGAYPFLCTFPGHWRRMRGVMKVVPNLEKYLADNPLPDVTPTLDARPFVKDWKYEDLVGSLAKLKSGRSYTNGKNLFKVAACATCHKMGETGGDVGPNLAKWDPKLKPADLLRELTDPSKIIKEKFRTWVIVDRNGRQHTGMIVKQDKSSITLQQNPLSSGNRKSVRIAVVDIELKRALKTSMMPAGLLRTLKRDEILDLLAYILARGRATDRRFR